MTSNFNSPYGDNKIHVNSYVKRDGTEVRAHERSRNENMCYPYDYKSSYSNPYAFPAKYQKNDFWGGAKFYTEKATVNTAPNEFIYKKGAKYAKDHNLTDSWELFKVGSVDHDFNPTYVQKNGKMHDSLNALNDEKLVKNVKTRLY